jgi:uncharacterized membrane protein
MIEIQNSIRINRPLQEVFAFISNFENLPKWNYHVLDVKKEDKGPVGEGTTYHQTRKTDQQRFRVVELITNKTVAIKTLPPEKELLMRFSFQPESNGTRVLDEWRLETDIPRILQGLASKRIKSAVLENLGKLKKLLETGHVTLQDGRKIGHDQV